MPVSVHADLARQHRLSLAFIAALGLHFLILGVIKLPVARIQLPVPSMALQWVDLPARKPRPEPVAQKNNPPRLETRRVKAATAQRVNEPGKNEMINEHAVKEPGVPTIPIQPKTGWSAPVRLDPVDLKATARSIAKEMAREEGVAAPAQSGNPADRPTLPQLEQAFKKPVPGAQRFEGGLVKFTTKSGRVYCLQEQPGFARGGPVESLSVPTNCP